ncbi:MAG: YfiR family protein [Candidatus Aminicenantales bacterium]
MKRTMIAILAAFGLAAAGPPLENPRIACDIQFGLTVKILTFDRKLAARVGDDLVFGILYLESDPVSLQVKIEMEQTIASMENVRIGIIPVRPVAIALDRSTRWDQELKDAGVDLAYLAPMRDTVLVRVINLCREMKVMTVGSLPDYAARGATIGFQSMGGRSEILINLKAAGDVGADFNSRLLAMSKVFR